MSETEKEKSAGNDENTSLFEDFSDPEVLMQPGENTANSFGGMESAPLMDTGSSLSRLRARCPSCTLKTVGKWFLANLLLLLTIASVIVGAIIGISVREADLDPESYRLMVTLLGFPGEIFLRMLKMLILPLIIFSLIAGLGSLETKVAGSLGWKTVLYYMTTTILAVILGLILVNIIKPGGRDILLECDNSTVHAMGHDLKVVDSVLDLFRNMLPDNLFTATFQQTETEYIVQDVTDFNECMLQHNLTKEDVTYSMATTLQSNTSRYVSCMEIEHFLQEMNISCENATERDRRFVTVGSREGMNVLGIIIFTIAFGITLGRLGPEGRRIVQAIGVLNNAIMKLVSLVMWYSPIGIASIIAGKLAEVESFSLLFEEIGLYFVTVLLGVLTHGCIILPLIYTVTTRSNPLKIVKAVLQALLTAFGTSSSSATLPITIQNLEENFHADPRVTRFMLPVGATINMDGTALYEAVAAVFIAQVQRVSLSVPKMIIISITATCASVGAAGVPQAGLFTLVIVLVAVGLNPDDVALILAVDWLLDRFRTTVNVLGDSFGVGIVEHYSRKQLGQLPRSDLRRSESTSDSSSSFTTEHLNREGARSPDYGTSSSPPLPTLPIIPTPQWSLSGSSHEKGDLQDVLSIESDKGGVSEEGPMAERGGARKRLSQGSMEIRDLTKDETYL